MGLKTRKVFSLAAKIFSSQFYQIQRLVLCHSLSEQDSSQLPTLLGIPSDRILPYIGLHLNQPCSGLLWNHWIALDPMHSKKTIMVSYLNPYCNFLDILTKYGQTLLSNGTDKFESPLVGNHRISLCPGRNNFQLLKDNLTQCSKTYGYHYHLTDVATTWMVTPGVALNPDIITYSNPIKIMDVYDDKCLELAQNMLRLLGVTILS